MADLAKLVVKLEAQSAQYVRELEKANKKLDKFSKKASNAGKLIGSALGGVAIGKFTQSIIRATAKQEAAVKQLEQGLATTGNAVGLSLRTLTQQAAEFQKVTAFGDEDIIAAQSQLVTFTKIAGDEFTRTTELVLDLSARMGTDLKSSAIQLGKALNDPVANLSALSRAGIQFSAEQKAVIKALVDSGQQAEAQKVILKELEVQFGGSAKAAGQTFGGALAGLKNDLGDLLEADKGLPAAAASISDLRAVIADPAFQSAFETLASSAISAFAKILSGASQAIVGIKSVFSALKGEDTAISRLAQAEADLAAARSRAEGSGRTAKSAKLSIERLEAQVNGLKDVGTQTIILGQLEAQLEEVRASSLRPVAKQNRIAALKEEVAITQNLIELAKQPQEPPEKPASVIDTQKGTGATVPTPVAAVDTSAQFQSLVESLIAEEAQISLSYFRRQELVKQNTIAGSESQKSLLAILREEEAQEILAHQARLGDIEAQGAIARAEFEKKTSKEKTKSVLADAISLTQGTASSSKKLFKINKAAALASAIVAMPEHISGTMAKYPFPISVAMGALAAANSLAQINAIRKAKFGGGGGGGTTPSAAGSTPTVNGFPVSGGIGADVSNLPNSAQQNINVRIDNSIDPTGTRRILEAINEQLGDGYNLNVEAA